MVNATAGGAVSRPGVLALALCALAASDVRAQTASKRPRKPPPVASQPKSDTRQPPAGATTARAWVPPPNEADVALLRGLLYAFEPAPREIRILAAEDLALLGDPRALDALAHLVFDRDPEVARAAVRAVTRFQDPRADQMLGNILRHPAVPEPFKVIAVEGLPFQDSPRSRALLTQISISASWPAALRNAARSTLERMAAADPVPTR
jgi:HEAT repeat protein